MKITKEDRKHIAKMIEAGFDKGEFLIVGEGTSVSWELKIKIIK